MKIDRQTAICTDCPERVADYGGTWLHVADGERHCNVKRPVAKPRKGTLRTMTFDENIDTGEVVITASQAKEQF